MTDRRELTETIQKFFNLDANEAGGEGSSCDGGRDNSMKTETETVFDTGKSSTSGMPIVEDGLSSSQGSDTEDAPAVDTRRPSEILKRR